MITIANNPIRHFAVGALSVSLLIPGISSAATSTDPVIVTATRTARSADETLASVTVITRKDIERLQAQSVHELLRHQAGFSVSNNGGAGKNTSVFIRGSASDHVLVLIDGIKVGSATSGTAAFQNLPIEQIERIEIVRGPRSSLYGSEAIGGVIQIFTRKGKKTPSADFSISAGRYNTKKLTVGASGGSDQAWYAVNFSGYNTNGFNACTGKPSPGGAGCFTNEPDRDGYRSRSGSIRTGYRFNDATELDVKISRTDGAVEFDGDFQNESDFLQQIMAATLTFSPTDIWHSTLAVGRSWDESDNFKDGIYSSTFDTERDSISWQNDFSIDEHQLLTLGLDYTDDKIDSSIAYPVTSRYNTALFTQYQTDINDHDLILAARVDDNEQFGEHTTGSLSWGYNLNPSLRMTASVGTAYKAPSFNELYFPGFGNANLQPESSITWEAGLRAKPTWGHWDITFFQTQADDLIAFDASAFAPANINSASIRGIEAQAHTKWGAWLVGGNITLLDTENESADTNQGNELPRRAGQSLNINLDRDYGAFTAGLSLHTSGSRYDDLANTRKLKSYTTIDLRSSYQLNKNWLLQASVKNIFDEDYETAAFYNQPESDFLLTLRYQPPTP